MNFVQLGRPLAMGAALPVLLACARTVPQAGDDLRAVPTIAADSARYSTISQSGTSGDSATVPPTINLMDLNRRTADLFGAALKVDVTLRVPGDSARVPVNEEPSWDIDVRSYETFERVRHYVAAFTGPSKDRFVERLSRGTRYESMIREKLREGGLPEDMYYL